MDAVPHLDSSRGRATCLSQILRLFSAIADRLGFTNSEVRFDFLPSISIAFQTLQLVTHTRCTLQNARKLREARQGRAVLFFDSATLHEHETARWKIQSAKPRPVSSIAWLLCVTSWPSLVLMDMRPRLVR